MAHKRKNYTYREAQDVLTTWIERHRMNQKQFSAFLSSHGITISPQTCSALVNGRITPGPMFKQVFREITGITLVDGLVEDDSK